MAAGLARRPVGGFALVGASAVLAASTRAPISSIVLALELTRRLDTLMAPVILATVGAVIVASRLEGRSVYSARIHDSAAMSRVARLNGEGRVALPASAHYGELAQAALRAALKGQEVVIVDVDGDILGSVSPASVEAKAAALKPLDAAAAADFL